MSQLSTVPATTSTFFAYVLWLSSESGSDCGEGLPSHKPFPPRICGSQSEGFLESGPPACTFVSLVRGFPGTGRWVACWWVDRQPLVGAGPDALRRGSHPSIVSLGLLLKLLFRLPDASPRVLSTAHWAAFCHFWFEVASHRA